MILVILLSLNINFIVYAKSAEFVSVSKNKEYFWRIGYNKDVCEDLEDDTGGYFSIDTEIEGKKIFIYDIDEKRDYIDPDHDYYYLYVRIKMKTYYTSNYENGYWSKKDDDYKLYINANMSRTDSDEVSYSFTFEDFIYSNRLVYGYYIIPDDIDYNKAEDSIELQMTEFGFYDEAEVDGIQNENSGSFKIKAERSDIDKVEYTIRYTSYGLLEYYELKYDNEVCLIQQLQTILPESIPSIFVGIFIFCVIGVIIVEIIQRSLIKK